MKNKTKIGKIIGIILFTLVIIGLSYFVTYEVDNYLKKQKNVNIEVTFDDTEFYTIPYTKKSDKETMLKEWPYMFTIKSSGNAKGLYQIIIKDKVINNIKRENLEYVLILDEKEVKTGLLSDISNNVLYESSIKNSSQRYKLYIWNKDDIEKCEYSYQITINAIYEGGPGF